MRITCSVAVSPTALLELEMANDVPLMMSTVVLELSLSRSCVNDRIAALSVAVNTAFRWLEHRS
jgi:hypothetical protein